MNSKLVDTHVHLCDAVFDNDRSEVLEKALKSGVGTVIAVGENLADAEKNLALSKLHPMIKPAAGLYPEHVDLGLAHEMRGFIRKNKDRLVAIGEVGLDFWVVKEKAQKDIQREIFKDFIALSRELNLPLNVHSRSAGRHAVAMLLEYSAKKVQLHAFDGKAAARCQFQAQNTCIYQGSRQNIHTLFFCADIMKCSSFLYFNLENVKSCIIFQ